MSWCIYPKAQILCLLCLQIWKEFPKLEWSETSKNVLIKCKQIKDLQQNYTQTKRLFYNILKFLISKIPRRVKQQVAPSPEFELSN